MSAARAPPDATIERLRRRIEQVDRSLVGLYADRRALVLELWEHKQRRGLSLEDRSQEARIGQRARRWAAEESVDPAEVERWILTTVADCKRAAQAAVERGAPRPARC